MWKTKNNASIGQEKTFSRMAVGIVVVSVERLCGVVVGKMCM